LSNPQISGKPTIFDTDQYDFREPPASRNTPNPYKDTLATAEDLTSTSAGNSSGLKTLKKSSHKFSASTLKISDKKTALPKCGDSIC
jgi:hypothetical protein